VAVQKLYSHGEAAEARLINGSGEILGYNFCMAAWEFWTGDEWRRIVPLRMCAAALAELEVWSEAILRETVDTSWEEGKYRFVLSVTALPGAQPFHVTSDVFQVVR
jgi:hypothetical protein